MTHFETFLEMKIYLEECRGNRSESLRVFSRQIRSIESSREHVQKEVERVLVEEVNLREGGLL